MPIPLFSGYTLAVLWDCDDTLIPGYMQRPIFEEYGVDEAEFWADAGASVAAYRAQGVEADPDTVYLLTFLSWVRDGRFPGLTIAKLKDLGARLRFHPGMPEAMQRLTREIERDPRYAGLDLHVEHYVVSQGLRQLLAGSSLARVATRLYGCDFLEDLLPAGVARGAQPSHRSAGRITGVATAFGATDKTRALFEISKGTAVDASIGVNDAIAPEDRRIPLHRIIYVADGPTDIPVWSILNQAGGRTMAVYNPASPTHRQRAIALAQQGRVQHVTPADYRRGRDAYEWLATSLREMADRIVAEVAAERSRRIRKPGGHLSAPVATPARPRVLPGGLSDGQAPAKRVPAPSPKPDDVALG